MIYFINSLAILALSGDPEGVLPNTDTVRKLLLPGAGGLVVLDDHGNPVHPDPLLKFGSRLFPAYEEILSDPKSDRGVVANAFYAVYATQGDRKRFIEIAINRLTDKDFGVKAAALQCLGEIGREQDTVVVLALFSDHDLGIRKMAARTLAKIGGKNDLVAIDIWLNSQPSDEEQVKAVKESKKALEKRLAESQKNKK